MGQRIRTQLDMPHPDLSLRISEKTKLGDRTSRRVFQPGDPVTVKDYWKSYKRSVWACNVLLVFNVMPKLPKL